MSSWWKPREDRSPILLAARMRDAEGWHDVTICNASSRGLMVRANPAPPTGSFVEVHKADICIVGQVKWSKESCFGLRTQDRIDVRYLRTSQKTLNTLAASNDRRVAARSAEQPFDPARMAERSRAFSRLFDYAIVASVVIAAAILLSQTAGSVLKAPLARAVGAMESARGAQ